MGYWSKEVIEIIHEAKEKNPAKNFIILDELDLRKLVMLGKRMDEEIEKERNRKGS